MERTEVFKKLTEICREVFEDEGLEITEETTEEDVEGWDSLTHFSLISEIETEFGIRFTLDEIQGCRNVKELTGALCRHVERKDSL